MKWRRVREEKLKLNPLCEMCGEVLAEEIHHLKPLEDYTNDPELMEQLAYDPNNLQSLCKYCHHKVHTELRRKKHSKAETIKRNHQQTEDFLSRFFGDN